MWPRAPVPPHLYRPPPEDDADEHMWEGSEMGAAVSNLISEWASEQARAVVDGLPQGFNVEDAIEYADLSGFTYHVDDDGKPELDEIKNYSPYVRSRSHAACTTNNGGRFLCGNTEERLKKRVLGTRQRGLPSEPAFDHATGRGFVAATPLPGEKGAADYADAIVHRKARVRLLVHERTGAFSPYAARRLRRSASSP